MSYKFSAKSFKKLNRCNPILIDIFMEAIRKSAFDFSITEGVRTLERQKKLKAKGKTHILRSKHLTGDAVDICILIGGKQSWDHKEYASVADVIKKIAKKKKVDICWGGAWRVEKRKKLNITKWKKSMAKAQQAYIDMVTGYKNKPFLDSPHFEVL